jgi:hypothetical protein
MIQARFSRVLAAKGWVLVNDVSLADHILRVDFTPDPEAPEASGHATVLSIRRNPRSMVARRGTGPYSNGAFSYSSNFSSGWMSSGFYSNSYYGYGGFYDDGYFGGSGSYTPVIFTPTPKTPPLRHHPGFRDDCPPGHNPGQFAGHISDPANDRPRPPPSDYGRWSGEPTTARADRSYSRSDSSHSRSGSSYSRSDTYSPPTPSYSSYESSYSSPSYSDSASSVSNSASAAFAISSPSLSRPSQRIRLKPICNWPRGIDNSRIFLPATVKIRITNSSGAFAPVKVKVNSVSLTNGFG